MSETLISEDLTRFATPDEKNALADDECSMAWSRISRYSSSPELEPSTPPQADES